MNNVFNKQENEKALSEVVFFFYIVKIDENKLVITLYLQKDTKRLTCNLDVVSNKQPTLNMAIQKNQIYSSQYFDIFFQKKIIKFRPQTYTNLLFCQ